MNVFRPLVAAAKALAVLTLLLGVLYPATVTAIGRLVPGRADGSLLVVGGQVVGSALLGPPPSADPRFFQGRPSASDASGQTSGGTNLGPSAPELAKAVTERAAALRAANPQARGPIPADALTASGSGLDPDISPEYAAWQSQRVATASGLPLKDIEALVSAHTASPALGFIGAPRVNVSELNVALAQRLDVAQTQRLSR